MFYLYRKHLKHSIAKTAGQSRHLLVPAGFLGLSLAVGLGFCIFGNTKVAEAACQAPATSYGTDTMSLSVPSSGTYSIWVRMMAPDTTNNSLMLQMDGGTCYNMGGSSAMSANTWTWVDYQNGSTASLATAVLSSGSHSIELIGSDPGVSIDRVELLADTGCTPSGTGENCAPSNVAPPSVSFTSPTSGATVSGKNVAINTSASSASGVSQVGLSSVVIKVDGSVIADLSSSPYDTTWDSTGATNGTHTLAAVATDTQGQQTTATESFTVNNNNGCSSAPTAPGSLSATSPSPTSVKLTWTASTPATGCSITHYNISQGSSVIDTSGATSYTLSGLTPNSTYSFSVTASDSSGHTSASSNKANVTTEADTAAPSVPGSVTASALSATQVKLSWTPSTDNVGVAYYHIYRNGSIYFTTAQGATSFTDNNVAAATTYTYTISAVDTSGNESTLATTTPAKVTTPSVADTTQPSTPTNLHTTLVTATNVALSWTASTDNVAVAGYHIYRNSSLIDSVTSGTSYTDSGLSASTTYRYYVVAYDTSANNSTASSTLSVTTLAGTTTCSPDINGNKVVDIYDASILFGNWGKTGATCAEGDLNGNKVVDIYDASILFGKWGDKE